MDSSLRFNQGERLTAAKLNELVLAVNAAGAGGESPVAGGRVPSYRQAQELRMPVEPAGGIYDRRRGLSALGVGIPGCEVDTAAAWLGHGPGVQGVETRSASDGQDGVVWALHPQEGAEVWQVVRTDPNGEVCTNCTRYVAPGCVRPEGHAWSVRANEGGQVVRLMGRVVRSALATCGDFLPEAVKFEVLREHDLQMPVLTQGARIAPKVCHTGYQTMVDSSRENTAVVYNLGLHSPELDFKLTYDATSVIVWQNQVQPAASGGHVWRGPGAVNGSSTDWATRMWWGHVPAVATQCTWEPGCDNQKLACSLESCIGELTAWQRVQTNEYGGIQCVAVCVRPSGAMPPGGEQLWNPDECLPGTIWHRIGHVTGDRAITDVDWRLPILTQNAVVRSEELREKALRLVVADGNTQNRFVKRLIAGCGVTLCDLGCAIRVNVGVCG